MVPIHVMRMAVLSVQFIIENIFLVGKAAQGGAARRTWCAPQPKTRGESRPVGKRPFMDGD